MQYILRKGDALETFSGLDADVSLLASNDGTEMIHHRLKSGAYWTLRPEQGWRALEHLYVVSGCLRVVSSKDSSTLEPGDSFSAYPVTEHVVFWAERDTVFIYVTSRPVFHQYSNMVLNLKSLAVSVEEKDGYTADHCHRIMDLSMTVASELKLSAQEKYDLQLGAFLHDLGKVRIPDCILNKPSQLSPDEWVVMKQHATHSAEMIEETGLPYLKGAAVIAGQHHERFDGSGYPCGLKEDNIHIGASIVGVVDSFDAMTSHRVYRKARPLKEAMDEVVYYRGTLYHPNVVDAFVKIMAEK